MRYFIILLTLLFSFTTHAVQTINHYNIDVVVNNDSDLLAVQVELKLDDKGTDDLSLILHPAAKNLKISTNDHLIEFHFDRDSKTKPNMYFDGLLLTISEQKLSGNNTVTFDYEMPISAVNYWEEDNVGSEFNISSGFELGMYTSWLPFQVNNGSFSFLINVTVPESYSVVGNGLIKQTEPLQWQVKSVGKHFDVPLIVSKELQTDTVQYQQLNIEVSHFGFSKEKTREMYSDIAHTLSLFESKFGASKKVGKLQFVFVPRVSGTSYSRLGFAVIAGKSQENMYATLAHEIAHFWWAGADNRSWEDWVNESFAEYSSLIAFKQKYGKEKFVNRLKKYEITSKESKAIWGVDRHDDIATVLFYRKGSMILEKLRERIGDANYYRFLSELASEKSRDTKRVLALLEKNASILDSKWLEQKLKQ